jgi:hypothetical protein
MLLIHYQDIIKIMLDISKEFKKYMDFWGIMWLWNEFFLIIFSDIDECSTGVVSCSAGQRCVNSAGSYECITVCPKGSTLHQGICIGKFTKLQKKTVRNKICVKSHKLLQKNDANKW